MESKTFGSWVCPNCGFFLTSKDTRGIDPLTDFHTGFNHNIRKSVVKMKKERQEKKGF